MRVLVTGANGFVGRHLLAKLKECGHQPLPMIWGGGEDIDGASTVDIMDPLALGEAVECLQPEACVHLAAVSSVVLGKSDPGLMYRVNVKGTLSLLEAFRSKAPASRVIVASTAHVYGTGTGSVDESSALNPQNEYAISKVAADLMALSYAKQYGLHYMTARPLNHTGPGQSTVFAIPSFASQLKEMAAGTNEPRIQVGNLDSMRNFSDVRDVVAAYVSLLDKGRAGEAYNIASGPQVSMRAMLGTLCEISGVTPEIVVDPDKFRPTDNYPDLDTSKLKADTGWEPTIDLATTLRDLYEAI